MKSGQFLYWGMTAVWTAMIYGAAFFAVPLARTMFSFFNMNQVMTVCFAGLSILGAGLFFLKRRSFQMRPQKYALFILLLLTFALQYVSVPIHAKRFHLMEYAVLSGLIFSALQRDFKGARLWVFAFLGAALVGLGDEALQHWIPNRISSWADILTNLKGTLFGLLFLAVTIKEKNFSDVPKNTDFRTV